MHLTYSMTVDILQHCLTTVQVQLKAISNFLSLKAVESSTGKASLLYSVCDLRYLFYDYD